jgi:hypothetical protein
VDETDKIEEKWIKINLALEIDSQNHIIRATETWETQFRGADENSTFGDSRRNEGWGIVTPEGNLFLLMKTEPYHHNYYYLTIARIRRSAVQRLIIWRYYAMRSPPTVILPLKALMN